MSLEIKKGLAALDAVDLHFLIHDSRLPEVAGQLFSIAWEFQAKDDTPTRGQAHAFRLLDGLPCADRRKDVARFKILVEPFG